MTAEVGLKEMIVDKPPTEYLNIRQKLEKINYFDSKFIPKNVGLEKDDLFYRNFSKQKDKFSKSSSYINKDGEDLIEESSNQSYLDEDSYHQLQDLHQFTDDYVDSTIRLAYHYGIFRDLFFQEPYKLETMQEVIAANACDKLKTHLLQHHHMFYFSPLVPISARFLCEDKNQCLKSFQGNIIPNELGSEHPIINLNTSSINDRICFDQSSSSIVSINSGSEIDKNYYTLALVNLDSLFPDYGVCHWLLANIHQKNLVETEFDTIVRYLPIYSMRGFGYHRYVFVLFQHRNRLDNLKSIDDFDLFQRRFNALEFMADCSKLNNQTPLVPIGLTWFQTTWSDYCKSIFHEVLGMRSPTYEYVFPLEKTQFKQLQYPARTPFNIYLDMFRDPKEMSKEVLLERLKSIDPLKSYDTSLMYPSWSGQPELPHIYPISKDVPDWYKSVIRQKRAHLGRFRGLRASSAILPLNNNADLDRPLTPRASPKYRPLHVPNPYPDGKRRPKLLKDTQWAIPIPKHHSLRVEFPDNLNESDREKLEQTPKV
ncbi:hypothetical protein NH340_JMT09096 [Sarcoptes scabiei]|nr:hypothetical protein NH340_JMT09096 [Sarcoptes scabiei]